jgi:hypothetical protein
MALSAAATGEIFSACFTGTSGTVYATLSR